MSNRSAPHLGLILHRGRDALFDAFVGAMAEQGYTDGRTVVYEPRFAQGVLERTSGFARELVQREVNLIVAIGAVGAAAARKATATIPIVFSIVLDPEELGFVACWDRPGGNMTGITNYDPELPLEQLSLLREIVPDMRKLAVFSDADMPRPTLGNPLERSCERAGARLGVTLEWFRSSGPTPDRAAMFRDAVERGCGSGLVLEVPSNIAAFATLAELAAEHRLPTLFPEGWQHDGLMSYGTGLLHTVPYLPEIIGRVLAGTSPGDIPVRQVRQHRLTLNLATARKIHVTVPPGLVARAAEVIA
jgi:putative tryptophan/tyrosine transport system substrate-binding protein